MCCIDKLASVNAPLCLFLGAFFKTQKNASSLKFRSSFLVTSRRSRGQCLLPYCLPPSSFVIPVSRLASEGSQIQGLRQFSPPTVRRNSLRAILLMFRKGFRDVLGRFVCRHKIDKVEIFHLTPPSIFDNMQVQRSRLAGLLQPLRHKNSSVQTLAPFKHSVNKRVGAPVTSASRCRSPSARYSAIDLMPSQSVKEPRLQRTQKFEN
jgi:hypothetical protein